MGDQDEGARVVGEEAFEPLHRVDVEVVGGLVEQQEVGVGEQRARQRDARELAAGQRQEVAVEHLVGQAEALDDAAQAAAVGVASRRLETALQLLIRLHRVAQLGTVLGEPGEALLGGAQRLLELRRPRRTLPGGSRARGRSRSSSGVCSCSQTRRPRARAMVPSSACSSPEMRRSRVVLPVPLRPTSTAWSWSSMAKATVVNRRWPPKDFSTLLKVTMLMGGCVRAYVRGRERQDTTAAAPRPASARRQVLAAQLGDDGPRKEWQLGRAATTTGSLAEHAPRSPRWPEDGGSLVELAARLRDVTAGVDAKEAAALDLLDDLATTEQQVLDPIAARSLSLRDWAAVRALEDDVGWALIAVPTPWPAAD